MKVSDIISRYQLNQLTIQISAHAAQKTDGINAIDRNTIRTHAACDTEFLSLTDITLKGFQQQKTSYQTFF